MTKKENAIQSNDGELIKVIEVYTAVRSEQVV